MSQEANSSAMDRVTPSSTPSRLPVPRTNIRPTLFASAVSTSTVVANLDTLFQTPAGPNQVGEVVSAIVTAMSSVISEMRSEIDNRPSEDVAAANDVNSLRQKLSALQRTNHMMSMHIDLMELKKKLEDEEVKKVDDRKTFVVAAREELYKEIVELLEAELSCSICNEVFVSPSVTKCGHTFCELCISRWTRDKIDCPICRSVIFNDWAKHTEMDNFIARLHLRLSDEIRRNRETLSLERVQAIDEFRNTAPATTTTRATRRQPTNYPEALRFIQEHNRANRAVQEQQRQAAIANERDFLYRRHASRRPADNAGGNSETDSADFDGPTARLRARFIQGLQDDLVSEAQARNGVTANPRLELRSASHTRAQTVVRNAMAQVDRNRNEAARNGNAAGNVSIPSGPTSHQIVLRVSPEQLRGLTPTTAAPTLSSLQEARIRVTLSANSIAASEALRRTAEPESSRRAPDNVRPRNANQRPAVEGTGSSRHPAQSFRRVVRPNSSINNDAQVCHHHGGSVTNCRDPQCELESYRRFRWNNANSTSSAIQSQSLITGDYISNSNLAEIYGITPPPAIQETTSYWAPIPEARNGAANAVRTIRSIFSSLETPTTVTSSDHASRITSNLASSADPTGFAHSHSCPVYQGSHFSQPPNMYNPLSPSPLTYRPPNIITPTTTGNGTSTTIVSGVSTSCGRVSGHISQLQSPLSPNSELVFQNARSASDIIEGFAADNPQNSRTLTAITNTNASRITRSRNNHLRDYIRRQSLTRSAALNNTTSIDQTASRPASPTPAEILPDLDISMPDNEVEIPIVNLNVSEDEEVVENSALSAEASVSDREESTIQESNSTGNITSQESNSTENNANLGEAFRISLENDDVLRSTNSTNASNSIVNAESSSFTNFLQPRSSSGNNSSPSILMECDSDDHFIGAQSPSRSTDSPTAENNGHSDPRRLHVRNNTGAFRRAEEDSVLDDDNNEFSDEDDDVQYIFSLGTGEQI